DEGEREPGRTGPGRTDPGRTDMSEGPVLVINAGSSSLKYQLVVPATGEVRAKGIVERIGEAPEAADAVADHGEAIQVMRRQIAETGVVLEDAGIVAVGHRVVHGGPGFSDPVVIDDGVV